MMRMRLSRDTLEWKARWEERGAAVQHLLGDTTPPGRVIPFSWKQYKLPGACALTFAPSVKHPWHTYMTLGLTQPHTPGDPPYPWEFSVRAREQSTWPTDLLYQLTTFWLSVGGAIRPGSQFPLVFFRNPQGELWPGLTEDTQDLRLVGEIRACYLWHDDRKLCFRTPNDEFSLLSVVAATQDEDKMAQETTPVHLLLFLKEMGISQICDPGRASAMSLPGAPQIWANIRVLSHDEVTKRLQGKL